MRKNPPSWKDPMPWGYQPRPPFFFFGWGSDIPFEDEPFDSFVEVCNIFVRQRMSPCEAHHHAVITDDDGVIVLGWGYPVPGELIWMGIEYGFKHLEGYPFFNAFDLEVAAMTVKTDPSVMAVQR